MEIDWLIVTPEEKIRFDQQYWSLHDPWITQHQQLLTLVADGLSHSDRLALYSILAKSPPPPITPLNPIISENIDYIYSKLILDEESKTALLKGIKKVLSYYTAADPEVGYSQGMDALVFNLFLILTPAYSQQDIDHALPVVYRAFYHILMHLNFRELFFEGHPGLLFFCEEIQSRISGKTKLQLPLKEVLAKLVQKMGGRHSNPAIIKRVYDLMMLEGRPAFVNFIERLVKDCWKQLQKASSGTQCFEVLDQRIGRLCKEYRGYSEHMRMEVLGK